MSQPDWHPGLQRSQKPESKRRRLTVPEGHTAAATQVRGKQRLVKARGCGQLLPHHTEHRLQPLVLRSSVGGLHVSKPKPRLERAYRLQERSALFLRQRELAGSGVAVVLTPP